VGLIAAVVGVLLIINSSHLSSYRDSYWDPNMFGPFQGGFREEIRYGYRTNYTQQGFGIFFCVLAGVIYLTAGILFLIWLYQAWSVVPREYGGPSPGMAVGLLFVPFFNLYWIFRVVPGLSSALQRALDELEPGRPHGAGFGLGVAACILSLIPYLNVVAIILLLIWINIANGAKNALIRLESAQGAGREYGFSYR
jgi:hypothetical protein